MTRERRDGSVKCAKASCASNLVVPPVVGGEPVHLIARIVDSLLDARVATLHHGGGLHFRQEGGHVCQSSNDLAASTG